MRKLSILSAVLLGTAVFAQSKISFEPTEGYTAGTINGQNGWEVTGDADGTFVTNQVITTEKFSDGVQSFKNAHEPEYNGQFFPIIGGQKAFDQPLDFADATISFDVFITETGGSAFDVTAYGESADEYVPVFNLLFNYDGYVSVATDVDYTMNDTDFQWPFQAWNHVKIVVSAADIKYYINETLVTTTANFSSTPLLGLTFLHDNYGGDAYYDNILINDMPLAVDNTVKNTVRVFPNPAKDILNISTTGGISPEKVEIFNFAGQKIISDASGERILDVNELAPGAYVIKVTEKGGKISSTKFIKE